MRQMLFTELPKQRLMIQSRNYAYLYSKYHLPSTAIPQGVTVRLFPAEVNLEANTCSPSGPGLE